jgi:hypothetical protein
MSFQKLELPCELCRTKKKEKGKRACSSCRKRIQRERKNESSSRICEKLAERFGGVTRIDDQVEVNTSLDNRFHTSNDDEQQNVQNNIQPNVMVFSVENHDSVTQTLDSIEHVNVNNNKQPRNSLDNNTSKNDLVKDQVYEPDSDGIHNPFIFSFETPETRRRRAAFHRENQQSSIISNLRDIILQLHGEIASLRSSQRELLLAIEFIEEKMKATLEELQETKETVTNLEKENSELKKDLKTIRTRYAKLFLENTKKPYKIIVRRIKKHSKEFNKVDVEDLLPLFDRTLTYETFDDIRTLFNSKKKKKKKRKPLTKFKDNWSLQKKNQ